MSGGAMAGNVMGAGAMIGRGRVANRAPAVPAPWGSAVRAVAQGLLSRAAPDRHESNNRFAGSPVRDGAGNHRWSADDEAPTDDLRGRARRPAPDPGPPEPPPTEPAAETADGPDEPPGEADAEWVQRYARIRDLRVEWRDDDPS